jgi:hypothetical protein
VRLVVRGAAERGERSGGERRLLDRGRRVLLEEAEEPAGRGARTAARVLQRDQRRQVERLEQRDAAELAHRRLGDEQVPAGDRSLEDGPRMTLCFRQCLSGAGGASERSPRRALLPFASEVSADVLPVTTRKHAASTTFRWEGFAVVESSTLQKAARAVGVVFLLVGVLGFIPGITTHYGDMSFAGHGSDAKLLGIFQVSILHNIVHLLFGIAGLALSRTWEGARNFLIGGGVVYLVLWIYGLVTANESSSNFVPVNSADDWLHFLLGVGMVGLGVALRGRSPARETAHARA